MKQIKTLVLMQLKDKLDFNWLKSNKNRIHTVMTSIIKFAVLTLIYTIILYAASLLKLIYDSDMPKIMTLVITVLMIMQLISCTIGLTKSLYYSEDNRVLITLPVTNNKIFISKLLVFFFYELKRSFSFTIPIILGCTINIFIKNDLHFTAFIWMMIPMVLIITIPVLLGALLSIPSMYVYRLVSKYGILKVLSFVLLLGVYVLVIVKLVGIIPDKIDMINQWPYIREAILNFLNDFEDKNRIITWITRTLIGEKASNGIYYINFVTVGKVTVLGVVCVILYIASYYISRPIFFSMMSKNFEFNKDSSSKRLNKKHSPFIAFNIKEFKVSIRSLEISLNYIIVYVTVPLLLLILNTVFKAIDKNLFGTHMSYAFNILLIVLPLLLSNGLVATLYSKEGRAGYIKKTKPVNPLKPLLAKLSFNIIFSIPSIVASVCIFASYTNVCASQYPEEFMPLGIKNTIILILAILLLYYAHLFYSATLDIINPQNEKYATTGEDVNNENENKSSIGAVIMSAIYALFAFLFFNEVSTSSGGLATVCNKLLFISILLAGYFISSYVLQIKAYYGQSKE